MLSHSGYMTASVMYCYHTNGSYNYPQMEWFKIAIIFHKSPGWLTSLTAGVCCRLAGLEWCHLRCLCSVRSQQQPVSPGSCSHGSRQRFKRQKRKVVHRGSGDPGIHHFVHSLLATASYKAILNPRTGDMKFTSWWEELQKYIAKGVGLGKSAELLSNTMKMSEKLLKLGGFNFLNKKKK